MDEKKQPDLSRRKPSRQGGRPPGTPNKVTVATRERIEAKADPVAFLAAVMNGEPIKTAPLKDAGTQTEAYPTIDQRLSAARILADKLLPNAKSRPITLTLPSMEMAADLVPAIGSILATMARGEIAPDEAVQIAGILEQKRRAIETVEIIGRLEALEAGRK